MTALANWRIIIGLAVILTAWWPAPAQAQTKAASPKTAAAPQALGQDIPEWQARLELARLLSYAKRYPESIAQYRKVVAEKPDLVAAKAELAKVLYWSGKAAEATELASSLPREALGDDGRLLLADLLVSKKDYPQAVALYKEHLAAKPDDLSARLKLAEVQSWMKKYDESLANYRLLIKARPDDIQLRRKYAFVLIWSGNREEAITQLEKTLN